MNRVFVADTPYQIFNSCNIQYHCNASDRGDLFIINNFRNAEAVAKRMKEIHLFENVILADRPVNIFTCKLFIRIHAVFRLIFPQLVIHEQLKGIRRKQLITITNWLQCFKESARKAILLWLRMVQVHMREISSAMR